MFFCVLPWLILLLLLALPSVADLLLVLVHPSLTYPALKGVSSFRVFPCPSVANASACSYFRGKSSASWPSFAPFNV